MAVAERAEVKTMNVLVTGGLGFIGSHTVVELIKKNHSVAIADNLANSNIEVLESIHEITGVRPIFYEMDITSEADMVRLFETEFIEGVIHFAGLKAVGESVNKPLEYYYNNILSTIILAKVCLEFEVNKFVFSSSATVYGDSTSPLREDMPLMTATNPYGESKAMNERILRDVVTAHPNFSATLLRYFNPIGAHESGLLGERPNGVPNNIMPYITKVANGEYEKLQIFGNDYNTLDGTGVRDYIHVVDLADAHVRAIEQMTAGFNIYNLGTGYGTSVLELVNTFMEVNNVKVPYEIVDRRPGDIATCYADVSKAEQELAWKARRNLIDMVKDSWKFASKEKNNKSFINA